MSFLIKFQLKKFKAIFSDPRFLVPFTLINEHSKCDSNRTGS